MTGIVKTLQTIADMEKLAIDVIDIIKDGSVSFSDIPKLFDLFGALKDLVVDAPQALPELSDLDALEVGQIGAAAYSLIKTIVDEFTV